MRRPDRPRHWTAVRVAAAGILVASLVGGPTGTVQASAIRVVSHGDRSQRVIALTFDDGVSPANCRRILATLVEQHVPATFFPIAEAMSLDPAFWRLVAQVGDPIGDHTWSHPQMPTLSEAAQFTQIDRARRAAESILGRPILRVFRPPYGAYNAATLKAAADAGFGTALLWDVSDADTSKSGTVARMRARAELGTDGSVVLMHCGPNATPYLLPDVIAWYRDRGFRFVTVPRLLGFPWSPGSTSPVSPARILGSLPALPSTSSGGPITGANGYFPPSTPTPTPAPQPTPRPSPRATPAPTSTPHPTPPPTPTVTAAPSAFAPSSTSPIATPAGSPTAPTPSARTVSLASERSADATLVDEIVALTGLALIAVLAIGSVALVRRVRRG